MFINEELDYFYRKLDYAIWQKESCSDVSLEKHKEAKKSISYYSRKIDAIVKQKSIITQLTLF